MQELVSGSGGGSSKDVLLVMTNILNVLPIASKKYCARTGIDTVFHQDTDNKITFDTLTERQKMFDADDQKNWRLLGLTVTIFAADVITIMLEQQTEVSLGVVDLLLEICKHYAQVQVFTAEEGLEEETIFDLYFKQVQVAWARIYGQVSRTSFEKCMKFLMSALLQDFRKLTAEETQVYAQRIYFCRFL